MSTAGDKTRIREALEKAGSAWIFRYWGQELDKNIEKIRLDLKDSREYNRRFLEKPDPFDLLEVNPAKGAAFFQVDSLMGSLEMKIMIWRILVGCEIVRVDFRYLWGEEPSLSVTLRTPSGEEDPPYRSQQPADFRVLRHFGMTGGNGHFILQGYYAAKGLD